MPLRNALLTVAIALLPACYDVPTGATAASDPAGGIGVHTRVDDLDLAVEAGPDGMGMSFASPEGDQVSMGVKVSGSGESAAMGVRMRASDGMAVVMEVRGGDDGARVLVDLTE